MRALARLFNKPFSLLIGLCLFCLLCFSQLARAGDLSIDPVVQSTPEWCWLAVGEMVFEHYGIDNVNSSDPQCGIIGVGALGTYHWPCAFDCYKCNYRAGNASRMVNMLKEYPKRMAFVTGEETPKIVVNKSSSAMSINRVKTHIDDDRPIVAGISPTARPAPKIPQHVALIVGYDEDDGDLKLLVNDPYPYDDVGLPNPYDAAGADRSSDDGAYWIEYKRFKKSLRWTLTITVRESGSHRPPRGLYCCDDSDLRWCKIGVNPGPVGSDCWCAGVPSTGEMCRN